MNKNKLKKLRLSRETLQNLTSSDAKKVVGGVEYVAPSCMSSGCCPTTPDEGGQG